MRIGMGAFFWAVLSVAGVEAGEASLHVNTVGGVSNTAPQGYVPPLLSNGSLCMVVDYMGGQLQNSYVGMVPTVYWAGRRYDPPASRLIPFGHFDWRLTVDGAVCATPAAWTQTLDTRSAVVACRNEYVNGVVAETDVFTPLNRELVVLKRRLTVKTGGARRVQSTFRYAFTEPRKANGFPRRVAGTCTWDGASQSARFCYQADGYPASEGLVTVFSDQAVTASFDGQRVDLSAEVTLEADKPVVQTFYLLFADSLEGKDYPERETRLRELARRVGYDGLFGEQVKAWDAYWDRSYVRLPDERLARMYTTAQYHLRANVTKWSFPVGIFDTHWGGRYFGWDEMFCYQALVSSNHGDLSRRCPEFRFAGLKKALYRKAHYGKPGLFGAQYPWETLEDGAEGAPPYGFWADHVFHMSNIAQASWVQYLYTDDLDYLKKTGYPVIKECARFFMANMVYTNPDGSLFIGKCTDLERLGTARQNPFMTSCGAIYTMASAAKAAALIGVDQGEAAGWQHAAAKLRESLPHKDGRYVPYADCPEESVASLGGLFPYPLFDAANPLQRNAAYHFIAEGKASGNMYPVGKSLCAWYAGWMAAALAILGDRDEPVKLMDKAAEGAGCFGEMFEINEPAVSRTPWFATASGNVVYALNQMLIQSRDGQILIAQGVPEAWKDYAFKLACNGDLVTEVEVKNGKLVRLTLVPGDAGRDQLRTLLMPAELIDDAMLDKAVVREVSSQGTNKRIGVLIKGRTHLVRDNQRVTRKDQEKR